MYKTAMAVVVIFLEALSVSYAQSGNDAERQKMMDSMKRSFILNLAVKSPLLRQGYISTDIVSPGTVHYDMGDNKLFKAKQNLTITTANFSIPVKTWKDKNISATVGYSGQWSNLDHITNYSTQLNEGSYGIAKNTISLSLSYSASGTLFGRPLIYIGNISLISDVSMSMRKISGTGVLLFPISRTATSSLSLGGIVIVDPTSKLPFVPFVSYWKKFSVPGLELFVDLPKRAALRQQLTSKLAALISSDINPLTSFYDIQGVDQAHGKVIYNAVGLKNALGLEYRLSKYVILGINGGLYTPLPAKMFNQGKWYGDAYITSNTATTPYFNITLSLLPLVNHIF